MTDNKYITLVSNNRKIAIDINTILYILIIDKIVQIHISDGKVYEDNAIFDKLKDRLNEYFIKIHQECWVSVIAIHTINANIILNNGEALTYLSENRENIINEYTSKLKNIINQISDEDAYQWYLKGEKRAANKLVEKYGDMLILYINGYIKDINEAEDLMIEAFSRLFAKQRNINGDGRFKAYLYKTARNLALRHKQKHHILFLNFDELKFEPQSDMLTDAAIINNERDRQLYVAMEKLKTEYREALYLVYFENMSYRNAATIMAKTESQITKLIYRGKQRLKTILEQEGFIYDDK